MFSKTGSFYFSPFTSVIYLKIGMLEKHLLWLYILRDWILKIRNYIVKYRVAVVLKVIQDFCIAVIRYDNNNNRNEAVE